ncbi:hypothetical protein [Aestuariispira insulae]|uniref:Uncharacterized protein n=1 Tax=Aestuariispira insulae TaxID=1461337 RepID=A0A3D9HEY4_9PROT|nr:hypothetical protein [Aestuariispira insulae]RED48052.1 hypothetical protein DFP90_10870 [Aestuariispira insulae]
MTASAYTVPVSTNAVSANPVHEISRFLHDMEYFAEQTKPNTWQLRTMKEELLVEIEGLRAAAAPDRLKWALMRFESYLCAMQPQDADLLELQKRLRGHSFKMRMGMQKRVPVKRGAVRRLFAA